MRTNRTRLILAAAVAGGLCAGQAWAIDSAGSGFWDVGATWSGGNVPTSADDVVIKTGHTITNRDLVTRYASNLTIQAGGMLTHTAHASGDSAEKYKVILDIVNNLTIEANGSINVDACGYYMGKGLGSGGAAGAYGGRAGVRTLGTHSAATTYGSITAPTNCGSGGMLYGSYGSIGGGAVILTAGGTSTVNGVISACGGINSYYTGSGGSVFLKTGKLTGSGTLKADGGAATSGGAGGGGRVAVIVTNSTDFGGVKMAAYGGTAADSYHGAPGTVYLERLGDTAGQGTLIVDGKDQAPGDEGRRELWTAWQNGSSLSTYAFSEIVLTNGALYMLDTNDVLDIANTALRMDTSDRLSGIYLYGGTLKIPSADFVFSNYVVRIGHTNSTFDPALASVTVGTNATFRIDLPWTIGYPLALNAGGMLTFNAPIVLNQSLTIPAGAVLNHAPHDNADTVERYKVILNIAGNLTIETNGAINVDGCGYYMGKGPGVGTHAAGHGGRGGVATVGSHTPGWTYGSMTTPTNCGSGGQTQYGQRGGGAAILDVRGTTTVYGAISACGAACAHYGGSGGSIFLRTAKLTGRGTLKADGADVTGGGGGGGRVAVIVTNATDFSEVAMAAYGGSSVSASPGAPGTVYRERVGDGSGRGQLIVDAKNQYPAAATRLALWLTMLDDRVKDTVVGTVIVTNSAILAVSNQTLTVRGDWFVATNATFVASTNSTVEFADSTAATIYTNNTFFNFTATNAGKVLSFEAGRTNTVNGLLKLGVTGSDPLVTLQSTTPNSQWYLTLSTNGGSQAIGKVSVKDSNAGGGQQLIAGRGSVSEGNNVNWLFPKMGGTVIMVW